MRFFKSLLQFCRKVAQAGQCLAPELLYNLKNSRKHLYFNILSHLITNGHGAHVISRASIPQVSLGCLARTPRSSPSLKCLTQREAERMAAPGIADMLEGSWTPN